MFLSLAGRRREKNDRQRQGPSRLGPGSSLTGTSFKRFEPIMAREFPKEFQVTEGKDR